MAISHGFRASATDRKAHLKQAARIRNGQEKSGLRPPLPDPDIGPVVLHHRKYKSEFPG